MKRSRPLFAIDPGWFFVLSGLVICAACVLLPSREPIRELMQQRNRLAAERNYIVARLEAHARFMDRLDADDETLVRRLAASQLNVVPVSERPVLVNIASPAAVTDWIDASVAPPDTALPSLPRQSRLAAAATGPNRLLFLASGALCLFVGLILGPDRPKSSASRVLRIDEKSETAVANSGTPLRLAVNVSDRRPAAHLPDAEQAVDVADRDDASIVDADDVPDEKATSAVSISAARLVTPVITRRANDLDEFSPTASPASIPVVENEPLDFGESLFDDVHPGGEATIDAGTEDDLDADGGDGPMPSSDGIDGDLEDEGREDQYDVEAVASTSDDESENDDDEWLDEDEDDEEYEEEEYDEDEDEDVEEDEEEFDDDEAYDDEGDEDDEDAEECDDEEDDESDDDGEEEWDDDEEDDEAWEEDEVDDDIVNDDEADDEADVDPPVTVASEPASRRRSSPRT